MERQEESKVERTKVESQSSVEMFVVIASSQGIGAMNVPIGVM